jgi:hypothetical protein
MNMTNTAGEEIYITFKPCSCNSTGGCEKCRPKINTDNYYKTSIPSEFEQWVESQRAKPINKKCPHCGIPRLYSSPNCRNHN